ncbi:uncharacterized protein LOC143809248 [Ranitomeya variabilis]|uniref:uncharacterized protein LOC143809248 n=1 Tax=Ranitomeya variabilis TaxID=490064 RepID=UPI004057AAD4
MQEQKLCNEYPRCNLRKGKIFWIGRSDNNGSTRNPTHLSPIKEKIRDVQLQKCSAINLRRPTDVFKSEKNVDFAAVEGATCSLKEKSKNEERVPSASQFSIRQKIDVGKNEIGEFCPSYSAAVPHFTTGKPEITVHNSKVATQAPSLVNLQPLNPVQKFGSSTLHLYIPTASYEEEEADTTGNKNEAPKNKDSRISRNALKVDPVKPLIPNSSKRMTDKWPRVPCKEALATANLSIQFSGDHKGLNPLPTRRCLIDNSRNRFLLEDSNIGNPIPRPVSNIGYRLGSYHPGKTTESSEYGLNVSTLKLSDDKPRGLYLLSQRRGLDKIEFFLRRKKEHEINEEQGTRCKSQSDILDFEKRKTYI